MKKAPSSAFVGSNEASCLVESCRVFETGPSSHLAAAVFLPLGG